MESQPSIKKKIKKLEEQILKERNSYKNIVVKPKGDESGLDALGRIRLLEEILTDLKNRVNP